MLNAREWQLVGAIALSLSLACLPGPQGEKGDQGVPGPQGPAGPRGEPAPPPVLAAGGGLAGSGTSADPLRVANGGITADHLAGPVRLYSRLMTPRWLQANADFHSARVVNITDTEVSFGAAGAGNLLTRLLTVPLLPANTLKLNETYLIRFVVNQLVASSDNDPSFGITDGTRFVGILKADSGNPEAAFAVVGPYGNNLSPTTYASMGGPGENAENFEFLLKFGPAAGGSTPVFFVSRVGTLAGSYQVNSDINLTGAVSFVVFAHDNWELYTFKSIEVTIDREG